jgi:hypothetical protein
MDDAQFGIIKILKPYPTFTTDYQGKTVIAPIMFTEGGLPLDAEAGTPGYSPYLIRGLSVPMGARISMWLPLFGGVVGSSVWLYKWAFTFRLRNVFDFRSQRKAYHYPKQGVGVPDGTFPFPGLPQVVIPAAMHSTLYAQPRPELLMTPPSFAPTAILQTDLLMVDPTNVSAPPFIPGGHVGYPQQGITDPNAPAGVVPESYLFCEIEAGGDELLIGMTRDAASNYGTPDTVSTWDFVADHADSSMAAFLASSPDIGVYVNTGKVS